VRYLHRMMERRKDPGFLNRVWQMSETVWKPHFKSGVPFRHAAITALEDALLQSPHSLVFCSHTEPDVFASGFCFDSYFMNCERSPGYESPGYEPEIFKRFGGRAVTQTWLMEDRTVWSNNNAELYPLPGLACRYFRFMPGKKPAKLVVRVVASYGHSLKAEWALAKGSLEGLLPGERIAAKLCQGANGLLECDLEEFSEAACHHAVLVVSNCAVANGSLPYEPPVGYKANVNFTVEAELIEP
jgi:hypothetical protein